MTWLAFPLRNFIHDPLLAQGVGSGRSIFPGQEAIHIRSACLTRRAGTESFMLSKNT